MMTLLLRRLAELNWPRGAIHILQSHNETLRSCSAIPVIPVTPIISHDQAVRDLILFPHGQSTNFFLQATTKIAYQSIGHNTY